MIATGSSDRYQTARELLDALEICQVGVLGGVLCFGDSTEHQGIGKEGQACL